MANIPEFLRARTRKQWIAIGSTAVVVVAGIAIGLVASGGSTPSATKSPTTTSTTPPVTTTTIPELTVPKGNCPLTDVRATNGQVPDRPALAVKVGNEPDGARPQSGLNEADIVFDTPAEGFIMRYVVVYQCNDAAQIGPTRSVRWVDWHLIRQLNDPILAYAGGIDPNLDTVTSFKWLQADNLLDNAASAGIRTTNRVPPDNLYTSTAALYGLSPQRNKEYGPPPPIFSYSAAAPAGSTPAASIHINFSYDTDVTWTWDAGAGDWVHSYSDGPDIDALTNQPVTTTNVVVLICKYKFGPYSEHGGPGNGDFESATIGSGSGYILRNGTVTKMTWKRRFISDHWTFIGPTGQTIALAPGRTWVEIVPNTTAAAPGALTITK